MRTRGIARFFTGTIQVRTWLGAGPNGDVYANPVTLSPEQGTGVLVDDAVHVVRNRDGSEVTSQGRIAAPLDTAALFVPDSLVAIEGGVIPARPRRVIVVNTGDVDGLPGHVVVSLT